MSKVALRVYNREIETLIDQGHIEEAIAHCQHILKLYPKHLETYRLLGKAYLEGRRYPDAADIFQRVLTTVPDDFISQLGMSIICDEQKDLDGAIWHMERAFEVNPSNAGVQGELRRLYGRRDGLEPPKIRLTRGALAQMYTKGGQHQQAIAEIKSVLAEDPSRVEMRVLLARAFYRGGQKVEATELCIDLLKQFPYCLDANRILVEVLPGTSLAQNLDTYKKRVQALDPYASLVTGSIFEAESIPDNAVSLERLEWEPGMGSQESSAPAQSDQVAAAIPDFLRTSGWGPSTGEFQEGAVDFGSDEPASPASSEIAAAQIPDWLKAMAPPGSSAPVTQQGQDAPAGEQNLASEDLDWLAGLGGPVTGGLAAVESQPGSEQPTVSGDQPDWMKDLGGSASEDQSLAEAQLAPAESTPSGDQPDWMKDLGGPASEGQSLADAQLAPAESTPSGDQPDWLKDLGAAQDQADTLPGEILPETNSAQAEAAQPAASDDMDWLKNLGGAPEPAASLPENSPNPQPEANVKKDLTGDDDEEIPPMTPSVSGPGTSESEQDDAMKWLESLAQKQGAKAEELITNPNDRTEHAPDWVAKVDEVPATPQAETPASPVPAQPLDFDEDAPPGELSPVISGGPGTTESEQDDAMKWLESLAERQGAKAEELITNPNERTESAPGWVDQVDNQSAPVAAAAPEQDDSMKWLEGLGENLDTKAEEPVANAAGLSENAPTWVTQESAETSSPVVEPAAAEDDTMAWLQGLASGPADEAPAESAPLEDAEAPAQPAEPMLWEQEVPSAAAAGAQPAESPAGNDVSEWLKGLEVQEQGQPADAAPANSGETMPPEQPAAEAPVAAQPNEEFPDWLNDMRTPAEGQAPQEDLPDWLKDQSGDEQPPASTATPEWVAAEEAPSPPLAVMEPPAAEPRVNETPTQASAGPVPAGMVPPAEAIPNEMLVSFDVPNPDSEPATVSPPTVPARPAARESSLLSDKDGPALQQARDLMAQGGLEASVGEYAKLVKRGKLLEEVIYDLKEATYSHPVDVVVWQALGDAHMRANQLQEALDAYTKAEELLR